ncbi:MAG: hypothetical protein M3252_02385 [Actinomycetota bacterium]|nr:hypothetical protein [Actinomycetota bacterium]
MLSLLAAVGWCLLFSALAVALVKGPRLRAWAWAGGLPLRLGALPVEEVEADEAPRGWKCAQLVISLDGTQIRLAGLAVAGVYAAEDIAVCLRGADHVPPALDCVCGFYAFCDRRDAARLLARRLDYTGHVISVLCEVDLAGTVIVCDRGYRAERQRVLQVGLLPWCAGCAARGRLVPAELLSVEHAPFGITRLTFAGTNRSLAAHRRAQLRHSWGSLRSLCDRCASAAGGVGLNLLQIAEQLGTEVRWLDAGLVAPERVLAVHRPHPLSGP